PLARCVWAVKKLMAQGGSGVVLDSIRAVLWRPAMISEKSSTLFALANIRLTRSQRRGI
ncbi:MAG: hypothetical protein RLZZ396_171, partial [Planctomycetota bacterium]